MIFLYVFEIIFGLFSYRLNAHWKLVLLTGFCITSAFAFIHSPGPHQKVFL